MWFKITDSLHTTYTYREPGFISALGFSSTHLENFLRVAIPCLRERTHTNREMTR